MVVEDCGFVEDCAFGCVTYYCGSVVVLVAVVLTTVVVLVAVVNTTVVVLVADIWP